MLSGRSSAQIGRRNGGTTTLMHGGYVNPRTGAGTGLDASEASFFTPTRVYTRSPWEVLSVQSWQVRKFINIPVDDMLIRWREWLAGDGDESAGEAAVKAMKAAEKQHHVKAMVANAMKAGRLMGTGLLVIVTREAPMDTPLMPNRIRQDDLLGLLVFDRYSAYVSLRGDDLMDPTTYGKPIMYRLLPNRGMGMDVHHSRIIRFDGIAPVQSDGFQMYDYDWGVSTLIPAMLSVMQDASVASAAAHLSNVASVPVLTVAGLREAIAGQVSENEPTAAEIGKQVNELMSVFRLLMLDKGNEEFTRVPVQFSGFDKIMDRVERRMASAADIPITRWAGQSPAGMNATGESDQDNYAVMVDANREDQLGSGQMDVLDEVVARSAGLRMVPEYQWRSLMEKSEKDQAEIAKYKAEAGGLAVDKGAIDEDEMRAMLDGDAIFGALAGEAPRMPMPEFPPNGPAGGPDKPPQNT